MGPSGPRRVVLSVGVACAMLIACAPAHGFGTVNSPFVLDQHQEHEKITRWAGMCRAGALPGSCFEPQTLNELAGTDGEFGGVGAPDKPAFGGETGNEAAHCDAADYLPRDVVARYPQTRTQASRALRECRSHLRRRFGQAIQVAGNIVNEPRPGVAVIDAAEVAVPCPAFMNTGFGAGGGGAKCDTIEAFGRLLHGVQDFYSHSNWRDASDPGRRQGTSNPPGLGRPELAPLLDMRRASAPSIPGRLSTGCFELREKFGRRPAKCRARIRHADLNKDSGIIDPGARTAVDPGTPRGRVTVGGRTNFARAVTGAAADSERQWRDLRAAIVDRYGPRKGPLIVCALTRDDPLRDCQGRRLAIVIDSSGSNLQTDPGNLRITAGQAFNSRLVSAADGVTRPDLSTVVDFDSGARVVSPLSDPLFARFTGIDSRGGTNIAAGINAATAELTRDGGHIPGRSGTVVLSDGIDSNTAAQTAAIRLARTAGIRVSFGFLAPPSTPVPATRSTRPRELAPEATLTQNPLAARTAQSSGGPPATLVAEILATGGLFATIDSAQAQARFIGQVETRGATAVDDPRGGDGGGKLTEGVASSEVLSGAAVHRWRRVIARGRRFTVAAKPLGAGTLRVTIRDTSTGQRLGTFTGTASKPIDASGVTFGRVALEAEVRTTGGAPVVYDLAVSSTGRDLRGTSRGNTLRCPVGPVTHVRGLGGNDRIICGAGDDIIDPGAGTDRVSGGDGNDFFVARRGDLRRGVERWDGGAGTDTAYFRFSRPKGTRCRGRTIIVRPRRGASFRLTRFEAVRFNGRRC